MLQVPGFCEDSAGNLSAIVNGHLITVTTYKGKRYLVSAITAENKLFGYVVDSHGYILDGELMTAIGHAVQRAMDSAHESYTFFNRASRQLYWEVHRIIPIAAASWVNEWVRRKVSKPATLTTDEVYAYLDDLCKHIESTLSWR